MPNSTRPHRSRTTSVLVSGAGIAGSALAYWLDRYGFRVTVVERAPDLRGGGQAVDVRGSALRVIERMGLLEDVRAGATGLRGMSQVDGDGRELCRTTERTASGGPIDSPDVEILRDELAGLLVRAAGPGVEYLFGDSLTTLVQHADGVQARFASGKERAYDLVVGADGLHSATRRLVFGPETDYLHPVGTYIASWSAPNHLGLDRWEVVHRTGGSESAWGCMAMTVRDNKELRVFVGFDSDEPLERLLPRDTGQQKRLVAEYCAGLRWEVPRFLKAMWEADSFHYDVIAQIRMDRWTRGRVALLGDAGYCCSPATGQGTSVALTAAYVLAGELHRAGGDHRAAFAAYEEGLRGYVTANQALLDLGMREADREAGQAAGREAGTAEGEPADGAPAPGSGSDPQNVSSFDEPSFEKTAAFRAATLFELPDY
ncbi:NAD(P)-binding protein [Streptomyces sp. SID10853]|uniref:FAD-dependent monooxygenase n=1 Tax=Streptomyces sp. SID10853 TaxID=2706028 RepID=UPI0013C0B5B9|nr:FAD-dependent monooxygenase [Streptomyces sp. SID10853]NDZ77324.1 NAD(P)-binding protein [Streptomyces sp. SID10853]